MRALFAKCGEVESVRLVSVRQSNWKKSSSFNENQVRDASTGIGKGFGYVNFVAIESVELALRMANQEVENLFWKSGSDCSQF